VEIFDFGAVFLLCGYTGEGSKMCHNGLSSSMDYSNRMTGLLWDMLPGDVAQRLAEGKWRNPDRNERTKGSETPL